MEPDRAAAKQIKWPAYAYLRNIYLRIRVEEICLLVDRSALPNPYTVQSLISQQARSGIDAHGGSRYVRTDGRDFPCTPVTNAFDRKPVCGRIKHSAR